MSDGKVIRTVAKPRSAARPSGGANDVEDGLSPIRRSGGGGNTRSRVKAILQSHLSADDDASKFVGSMEIVTLIIRVFGILLIINGVVLAVFAVSTGLKYGDKVIIISGISSGAIIAGVGAIMLAFVSLLCRGANLFARLVIAQEQQAIKAIKE